MRRTAILSVGLCLLLSSLPASAGLLGKSKKSKSSASSEKDAKARERAKANVEQGQARIREKSAQRKADSAAKQGRA
jgi:hypothetical protein